MFVAMTVVQQVCVCVSLLYELLCFCVWLTQVQKELSRSVVDADEQLVVLQRDAKKNLGKFAKTFDRM